MSFATALAVAAPSLLAQEAGEVGATEGLGIRAAKVLVCSLDGAQVLDDGLVLIQDGRIEAVGPADELELPEGYELLDTGDAWVAPGLIDLHCHVAGPNLFRTNDINDMVFMTNPGVRVSPAVIPDNQDLRYGVAGGVTSVLYIPGSGTNMGGQGVLLRTGAETYSEMEIRNPASLKLAQAGNPERFLMGVGRSFMNWNTRNTFLRGLAYARKWEKYEQGEGPRPEVDLQFEIFRDLHKKNVQVSTHTQIYQVVMTTVTMVKKELGLDVFIDHGSFDGWRAGGLAWENGVNAILGPRAISRHYSGFIDTDGQIHGIAAKYQEQGHQMIGFNTDSPVIPQQELSLQAAMGARYGLDCSNLEQVRGLTIVPATTVGLGDRLGSVEAGKEADLLIVTGDPADPRSSVEMVFQGGRRIYDAERDGRRW